MTPLGALFESLLARYGPQYWWPGEGRYEIMLGAVLVQRTAWRNAAVALAQLRGAGIRNWAALAALPRARLESLIRSAGFYRLKAARLSNLAGFVIAAGGCETLAERGTGELREALLGLDGIGPETADAMLLYAFERPVCVIDAYARRLVARIDGKPCSDAALRSRALRSLGAVAELNEFHALIVAHAKDVCRSRPRCEACCLRHRCQFVRRSGLAVDALASDPAARCAE